MGKVFYFGLTTKPNTFPVIKSKAKNSVTELRKKKMFVEVNDLMNGLIMDEKQHAKHYQHEEKYK